MHDEPEYLQEALARGAIGLVSKAASPGELIDAIKNAARGETMDASAVLTDRQREVLLLIGAGKTKQEIALLLSISEKTVDNYQQQLMEKLDIHTKIGLVAHARQLQLADN
jgi:DNA-binding NarL/FixJ family response regulator